MQGSSVSYYCVALSYRIAWHKNLSANSIHLREARICIPSLSMPRQDGLLPKYLRIKMNIPG